MALKTCNKLLKELRLEAKLSVNQMARKAEVDRATVSKAETGKRVQELSVVRLVAALSGELKRKVSIEEVSEDVEKK
ncbi:MAG: helix-turn-helix transcriptional regulator [Alphaproteobacteria bacterium]